MFWPTILSLANEVFQTDKTILMILLSCFGVTGMGLFPLVIGVIGDTIDLKFSYFLVPACFFLMIILLLKIRSKVELSS